jgi:hypothetical protein
MEQLGQLIPLDDRAAWEDALCGIPHVFAHTWESCSATHLATGARTSLYVWEGGGARVVCPVVERPGETYVDVVTPYGFSGFVGTGPAPGLPDAWRAFATERGWVTGFLQMNPLLPSPFPLEPPEFVVYKDVYVFDLRRGEDELFARLPKSRRKAVRRWERSDGRFVDDPDRLRDFGLRELPRFLDRKDAGDGWPVFDEAGWDLLLASEHTTVFGAEIDGDIVAINVLVHTHQLADDLLLVSLPGFESLSTAFQWEGLVRLKRQGIEHLNIGGGVSPGDGVERFKATLGADPVPLGALRQVYDRETYMDLCQDAGVDPDADGFFPPYRGARRS